MDTLIGFLVIFWFVFFYFKHNTYRITVYKNRPKVWYVERFVFIGWVYDETCYSLEQAQNYIKYWEEEDKKVVK